METQEAMNLKSVVDVKAEPGDLEAYPQPGLLVPEALKEAGVEINFGVWGGHMWPFIDPMIKQGIKHVTVRHEGTAGYAAEAYARVSGKLGVCMATAGPGGTNLLSSVHQAAVSDTPMLCLLGGHECQDDGVATLQECYGEKVFESFTKLSKRLIDARTYKFWLRKAIQEAMTFPRGPSVLEFELNALTGPHPPYQNLYLENWLKEPVLVARPDPRVVEKILDLLSSTDKPVLYAGDEVMWTGAQAELREFARLAQIPVMGRRGGRGSFPEDDPLIWKSADIGAAADIFLVLGARMDFYDFFGTRFQIKKAVQIAEAPEYVSPWIPTELAVNANVKATLEDLIAALKKKSSPVPAARASWLEKVREVEKHRTDHLQQRAEQFKDLSPVHPAWLGKLIVEEADEMYKGELYYSFDAFTGSNFLSPYVQAKFAGQILDAGAFAGVGHGIGQAIGASFGCDKKKMVLAMMGDGGMGVHGMDVETALRHKLPIVYVVNNNGGWMGGSEAQYGRNFGWYGLPEGEVAPHFVIPDQRYDKMFEAIGCHGEWVTTNDGVRPALKRAFQAAEQGKTAVVNIKVDRSPVQSLLDSAICVNMWKHIPWNEATRYLRKMRLKFGGKAFKFEKYGLKPSDVKYDRWNLQEEDYELGIPED
ncbi:thiamine pyrophosphate-binding protein [candidate division KSB1 bacterium]|nr:thiamine pyrophosphate-binding protein [candidate division KSB1 bacterium]